MGYYNIYQVDFNVKTSCACLERLFVTQAKFWNSFISWTTLILAILTSANLFICLTNSCPCTQPAGQDYVCPFHGDVVKQ